MIPVTHPHKKTAADVHAHLEKVMRDLNPTQSYKEHRMYLIGIIDTLSDLDLIDDEVHQELYDQYSS